MDLLPFALFWLFIMALVTLGLFLVGMALISLIIEREEAEK